MLQVVQAYPGHGTQTATAACLHMDFAACMGLEHAEGMGTAWGVAAWGIVVVVVVVVGVVAVVVGAVAGVVAGEVAGVVAVGAAVVVGLVGAVGREDVETRLPPGADQEEFAFLV